jgi:hypothetical protein
MFFKKDVPREVSAVKLSKWYDALDDRNKTRLSRYVTGANTSSKGAFLLDLMLKANAEENYAAAVVVGEFAEIQKFNNAERFDLTEAYIEALFGNDDVNGAKNMCLRNLELVPELYSHIIDKNGEIPENISCRNRLIDILVGTEKDYDGAHAMLERFNKMKILSDEDLEYRNQSLKVHRLQRTFDSIYSYKFTE